MTTWVRSADGTALAVYEYNQDAQAPTVVCVHGYPDNHTVWDGVVAVLAERYRVVTYDVRGAGASDTPGSRNGYRLDRLEEDLAAVADTVSPDEPVHLLGHDWGSVQAWHAVTGDSMRGRVLSYTSISGPCLDHAGLWLRAQLRPRPTPLLRLLTQLVFSGYIGFFQLPRLPESLWRTGALNALIALLQRHRTATGYRAPKPLLSDGINGLELYRANILPRFRRPAARVANIPVQVLAPLADPFVGVPLQTEISEWVPDLRVHRIRSGHWAPRTHPRLVAGHVAALVDETAPAG